jgi:hypothetical protein
MPFVDASSADALVGNKPEMLIACIRERAKRLEVPANLPMPDNRESLAEILVAFGAQLVREVTDPNVLAVVRLAIAEAAQAPEVARTLDEIGRGTARAALRKIMTHAHESQLLDARLAELVEQFNGLLWGDLIIGLLLGVIERPSSREITKRAQNAARSLLLLHPAPGAA